MKKNYNLIERKNFFRTQGYFYYATWQAAALKKTFLSSPNQLSIKIILLWTTGRPWKLNSCYLFSPDNIVRECSAFCVVWNGKEKTSLITIKVILNVIPFYIFWIKVLPWNVIIKVTFTKYRQIKRKWKQQAIYQLSQKDKVWLFISYEHYRESFKCLWSLKPASYSLESQTLLPSVHFISVSAQDKVENSCNLFWIEINPQPREATTENESDVNLVLRKFLVSWKFPMEVL